MDNKRFKMFLGITLIIAILTSISFYIFKQLSTIDFNEYVPQQEISDEQFRQTYVKLYFKGIDSNTLQCENRAIDSKELISNPYLTLVDLLIKGPNIEGLEALIPSETVINSASLNGDTVLLDLSSSFISSVSDVNIASNIVYSIVNTLTELTEVNCVKFLIDGNEKSSFSGCDFSLFSAFVRK